MLTLSLRFQLGNFIIAEAHTDLSFASGHSNSTILQHKSLLKYPYGNLPYTTQFIRGGSMGILPEQ